MDGREEQWWYIRILIDHLFLDPSLCSCSLSESSLLGLPLSERGDSDIPIPTAPPPPAAAACGSPTGPLHLSNERAFSYEVRIFWTKDSRASCEEDDTLRWICSCLASSLPFVSSFIRFFCSQLPMFSIFKPPKEEEQTVLDCANNQKRITYSRLA